MSFLCNLFKVKEGGLDVLVKASAFVAGKLIAQNNPELKDKALPVARGIQALVDKGGDDTMMNTIFQQGVAELLAEIKDPIIQASVMGVLSQLEFDPKITTPKLISNALITEVVDNFVNGMASVPK